MINVPAQFRPHIKVAYPPGNKEIFEEYFFRKFQQSDNEREYLPIFFTSYFVNNKYGKDKNKVLDLQRYVNSLPRDKKYFTITQYDDGPLIDFKDLDIKVFGSGGGRIDSPIALLTAPHSFNFPEDKKYFASFAGSNTHPIREQLVKKYHGKYMITKVLGIKDYCQMLSNSVFSLCPRGYGLTSFRICESLQMGSIPVYISDSFIIPYGRDFNEYGVLVEAKDIDRLDEILNGFSQAEIQAKQDAGQRIYKELFTFEGARKWIMGNI